MKGRVVYKIFTIIVSFMFGMFASLSMFSVCCCFLGKLPLFLENFLVENWTMTMCLLIDLKMEKFSSIFRTSRTQGSYPQVFSSTVNDSTFLRLKPKNYASSLLKSCGANFYCLLYPCQHWVL